MDDWQVTRQFFDTVLETSEQIYFYTPMHNVL